MEVMIMIEVLLNRKMLKYVQDMKTMSKVGRGFSDHTVVLSKVMMVST